MFFFNDTATTEIYTLSLHDALPISLGDHALELHALVGVVAGHPLEVLDEGLLAVAHVRVVLGVVVARVALDRLARAAPDRKSTRLNSSHANISYAVFCLKKKNELKA